MWEHFAKADPGSTTSGYATGATWARNLALVKESERRAKLFLGITQAPAGDSPAARYGWATMLLGAAGRSYFSLAPDYTAETWFPEYEYDIGEPVGPERADPTGVHRRPFTGGLVLVNPTDSRQVVRFGGAYSGSGLRAARSTTMGAHTGLVLHGRSSEPRLTRGRKPISLLAGTGAGPRVSLSWSHRALRGRRRIRRYLIYRDGRLVAVVRRRSLVDRGVVPGAHVRYRVAGVDGRGRIRAVSHSAVVQVGGAVAASSGRQLIRVSLASERRGLWRRAYLQRLTRRGGHRRWLRTGRSKPARARTAFRVRTDGQAVFRVVVRSSRRLRRSLRSAPFHPAQ